ncbi:hypothetical protein C8Q79DRAFT_950816 [Trametes meyenii]|nr:hypothetical protein C8Q79DRAFT_950816 [Trametes meyenii]
MTALGVFNVVSASILDSPLPDDINAVLGRVLVPILTTRFIANIRQSGRGWYDTISFPRVNTSLPSLSFPSRSTGWRDQSGENSTSMSTVVQLCIR